MGVSQEREVDMTEVKDGNRWTDKQKTALVDWLDENYAEDEYGFDLGTLLKKDNLSKDDIDLLRGLPGFMSVEARILPKSTASAIASLVGEYSSIEDIPPAYRQSYQSEYGITNDDLEAAFSKEHGKGAVEAKVQEQDQRRKDLEEARTWSSEKSIGDNLLATGLKLTPKEADRYYVRHGLDDPIGLSTSALLGGLANLLELAPFKATPVGMGISTLAPSALRTAERWTTGEKGDYDVGKGMTDMGVNMMSFLPVKSIYDLVKGKLGTIGQAADKSKAAKSRMEQFLTDLDDVDKFARLRAQDQAELELAKKLELDMMRQSAKDFLNTGIPRQYQTWDDLASWELEARKWEALGRPDMANSIRDMKLGDTEDIRDRAFRNLSTGIQDASIAKRLGYDPTRNKFTVTEARPFDPVNPTQAQKQYAIDKYIASKVPASTRLARTAMDNVARPGIRKYKSSDSSLPDTRLSEKELDNLTRQWEAGFVPRGGIELEYWKTWKASKEGK